MDVIDYDNLILNENIFGLEIVDNIVKVLELKKSGKRYTVIGFGEVPVDQKAFQNGCIVDANTVASAIKKARNAARPRKIKMRYASVVLPDSEIFVRVVKFPAGMKKIEIREAVEWKAKDLIAMPLEQVYWDWHRLPSGINNAETEVVISAVNKACADSYTKTLHALDIDPIYYDLAGNAASRFLFQKDYSHKQALLVRINKYSTIISLFLKGGVRYQTIISDAVKGGYANLVDFASSQLSVDKDKAEKLILGSEDLKDQQKVVLQPFFNAKFSHLKQGIDQVLEFYRQTMTQKEAQANGKDSRIDIYLYGKGSQMFHLEEFFRTNALEVKLRSDSPSSVSPIIQFVSRQSLLENLVLLGISIRNMGVFREMRDINLVPKKVKEKYIRKSVYSNLYASLRIVFWNMFLIVILLASMFIISMIYKSNIDKSYKAVQNVAESAANKKLEEDISYMNKIAAQIDQLNQTQIDWKVFFKEISDKRPAGITYTSVYISEDPEVWKGISGQNRVIQKEGFIYLVVGGHAETREQLQDYSNSMSSSDLFEEVQMPISNFETSVDINFILYCLVNTKELEVGQIEEADES
jgi:type IV pilus assembly protein PilM